jgi:hypothetical protein
MDGSTPKTAWMPSVKRGQQGLLAVDSNYLDSLRTWIAYLDEQTAIPRFLYDGKTRLSDTVRRKSIEGDRADSRPLMLTTNAWRGASRSAVSISSLLEWSNLTAHRGHWDLVGRTANGGVVWVPSEPFSRRTGATRHHESEAVGERFDRRSGS